MKQLNTILVLLAAMFILGCTPPERIDNSGNNSDNIENKDDDNKGDNNDDDKGDKDDDNNDDDDKGGGGEQNPLKQTTKPPYEIGDYYNENGKEGIVIEVDQDGNNGKIISLYHSPTTLQWASDSVEQNRLVGTIYMSEGVRNLAKIEEIPNWMGKYPAFKWCFDYGKGWYLPSLQEVERFLIFPAIREAINRGLTENGGTPLSDVSYWSSTEDDTQADEGIFRAKYVNAKAMTAAANLKKYKFYVRAVASFGDWYDEIYNDIYQDIYDNPNPSPNPDDPDPDNPNPDNPDPDNPNPNPDDPDPDNPNPTPDPDNPDDGTPGGGGSFIGVTKGPYKRGDYYNDGEKEGIVFYLDNDVDEGMHGQIVSLIQSETPLQWTSYYNYQCSYVIPNYVDNYGDEIMAYIKKISNWQTKFPAFAWCATLGDNWYLMDGFAAVRLIGNLWHEGTYEVVNKTLEEKNATKLFNKGEHYEYWLAGEVSEFDASYYDMYTDGVRYGSSFNKSDYKYVRAVAKF